MRRPGRATPSARPPPAATYSPSDPYGLAGNSRFGSIRPSVIGYSLRSAAAAFTRVVSHAGASARAVTASALSAASSVIVPAGITACCTDPMFSATALHVVRPMTIPKGDAERDGAERERPHLPHHRGGELATLEAEGLEDCELVVAATYGRRERVEKRYRRENRQQGREKPGKVFDPNQVFDVTRGRRRNTFGPKSCCSRANATSGSAVRA